MRDARQRSLFGRRAAHPLGGLSARTSSGLAASISCTPIQPVVNRVFKFRRSST